MRAVRSLFPVTAIRWTLAIAGGFTVMALFLFAFIYWQTAVREQGRVDGIVLSKARAIADAPGREAAASLEAWLAEDLHGVRYGGLFGPAGDRIAGNVAAAPDGLPADRQAHQVKIGPVGRDHDGDSPEIVRRGGLVRPPHEN